MKRQVDPERILMAPDVMPKELIAKQRIKKCDSRYKRKKVVLFIGYLFKIKGVDYLIRAFNKIKSEDVVLIIAGTGPEETNLRYLSKGDPRIEFVGYVDGVDKSNLYAIADIFMLPSLIDPWGFVVNEAMEFGLPIIVSKAAGASEMIKGNGIVVNEGDEDGLTIAIEKLLENDNLRKAMGERSVEIIKDYDIENGIEPFLAAIRKVKNEDLIGK